MSATAPTIAELARRFGVARVDAALLAGYALGKSAAWVAAHDRDGLPAACAERVAAVLCSRKEGRPVAYIIGAREFYGLALRVTPDVLIPRPETELLVDLLLDKAGKDATHRRPRILDLGTGSGAVAIAAATKLPQADVWAADCTAAALAVARENAQRHRADVRFIQSDWFSALAEERFDFVLGNPPYIPERDPHLNEGDLRFEPHAALCGGVDGLEALRRIIEAAPGHLLPGGWLLLEHGYDQGPAVRAMMTAAHWHSVSSWRDLAGHERVSGGSLQPGAPDALLRPAGGGASAV